MFIIVVMWIFVSEVVGEFMEMCFGGKYGVEVVERVGKFAVVWMDW